MASIIYGVSRNGRRRVVYLPKEKPILKKEKPKAICSHFSYAHTQMIILHRDSSSLRTLGKLTRKDPKIYGYLRKR